MTETSLYKKDQYLNPEYPYCFRKNIYEYDIKQAGYSLSRAFHLLDDHILDKVYGESKNKKEIAKKLGLIQRSDKDYKQKLNNSFKEIRRLFFLENKLEDTDILSIKKDAIFTFTKCDVTFTHGVEFVLKNVYTCFMLHDRLEFYYSEERNETDVKGIGDELHLHNDGFLKFINELFYRIMYNHEEDCINFVYRYINMYKRKQLHVDFYREFNPKSKYHSMDGEITYDDITDDLLKNGDIDIRYNYNLLVKILMMLLTDNDHMKRKEK